MTTTPITAARLSEIEMLRERARQWDGALTKAQHDDKRAALNGLIDRAIPELLAEVARLQGEASFLRTECNDAADTDTDTALYAARARIAALESGLREACDGWEDQWRGENNEEPPPDLAGPLQRLRALADGGNIKETT